MYLWQNQSGIYSPNSYLDYGWLIGFYLISIAQFRRGIKSEKFPPIPIFYLALSVIISSLMLAAIAANLYGISNFIIAPALATLFASFIRMAIALNQSEKVLAQESLARIDDLTGLPNRRKFMNSLEDYLNGSILLMDLDGFKPVNDQYGHETGDQLLRMISNRFQKAIPNDALLARLGGDEFAVLIHNDYESAMELAMALRATLSYPCFIDGKEIKVDVSIGCVANDGRSDLMSRADTAMTCPSWCLVWWALEFSIASVFLNLLKLCCMFRRNLIVRTLPRSNPCFGRRFSCAMCNSTSTGTFSRCQTDDDRGSARQSLTSTRRN